jgi:hypothetical protein
MIKQKTTHTYAVAGTPYTLSNTGIIGGQLKV